VEALNPNSCPARSSHVNDHAEEKENTAAVTNHATQNQQFNTVQNTSEHPRTAAQPLNPFHNSNTTKTTTMLGAIAGLQPRQLAAQVLNFALVLSTAFMLWKGLSVATDSSSPIVVVLSGSMEPAFQRGDLLFLWNRGVETQVGEVVVYNVRGKDIPIVHRVIRKYGGG
jgi:hypothetical protein